MSRLIALFSILLIPFIPFAQDDGDPDLTFNGTGVATFAPGPLHDNINRVAVQPDGKILFVGQSNVDDVSFTSLDLTVGRVLPDGSLDVTFGDDGYYRLTNEGGSDFGYDLELQSDGKILIGGGYSITDANTAFLVVRLNADGTPDNTFSGDGFTVIEIDAGEDYCRKIFPQADGSMICAGWSSFPGFVYNRITLCKLSADGILDPTFGNNSGIAIINQGTNHSYGVYDGAQEGEDLFLCGSVYDENLFADLPIIVKLNTYGEINSNFGTNGFLQSDTKGYYLSMINHGNGLYIAGDDESANNYDAMMIAYSYDGSIQSGFGIDGVSTFDLGNLDGWNAMHYMPDGRILATGVTGNSFFDRSLLAARFLPDGSIDTNFGNNGYITYGEGSFFDVGNDIALQPDGKIIIGGVTASDNNDMLLMRLYNGPFTVLPLAATVGATTPVSCFGAQDGTATLTVSGGIGPYAYYLDNGLVNVGNPITNLSAGDHSVAVIDAQGEVVIVNFPITQPAALTLSADAAGTDILATASGGSPPYLFSIGGPLQETGVFNNLPPGEYTLTVLDANGCIASADASVLVQTEQVATTAFRMQPAVSEGRFTVIGASMQDEMKVFNGQGHCVMTLPVLESQMTLDLTLLSSGLYYVTSGKFTVKAIIIK